MAAVISVVARKPTDAEGRKLRDAVYVDCSDKLFVFLKRRDAEPTNNESERAPRPSVVFRKVTNGFRSEWGAKTYAALCSIVETGRRLGRTEDSSRHRPLLLKSGRAASTRLGISSSQGKRFQSTPPC
jgi:Transposase IS66 family